MPGGEAPAEPLPLPTIRFGRSLAFLPLKLTTFGVNCLMEFDESRSFPDSPMKPPISALFLDMDQTLADNRFSADRAWEDAYASLVERDPTIPYEDLKTIYWRMSNDVWSVVDEKMPLDASAEAIRLEVWPEALRRVGCREWKELGVLGAERYWERRLETYRLYPDALPFLKKAREQVPVILITNGTIDIQEAKVQSLSLREYVDEVLIAQEVGVSKPSPKIFQRALDIAGCAPQEALMVGDNYERDVVGALQYGLRAVWIRRDENGTDPPYPPYPEAVVHDLSPLLSLLPVGIT